MPSTRPQRPYNVAYYAKNRDAEIERVMRRQRATLEWLRDLRRVPCLDCGGTFPPHVMDFDHRDPKAKLFNITASRAMLMVRSRLEANREVRHHLRELSSHPDLRGVHERRSSPGVLLSAC